MKKNKLLAVLLALAMTLSLLPTAALAAEGETCTGDSCSHVAVIGDKHYATLADAITAVAGNTPTTITLLKSVDFGPITATSDEVASTAVVIPAGKEITLELAGYTISASLKTDGNTYAKGHVLLNNGILTIQDSSDGKTGLITNTNTNSNDCTRAVKNSSGAREARPALAEMVSLQFALLFPRFLAPSDNKSWGNNHFPHTNVLRSSRCFCYLLPDLSIPVTSPDA